MIRAIYFTRIQVYIYLNGHFSANGIYAFIASADNNCMSMEIEKEINMNHLYQYIDLIKSDVWILQQWLKFAYKSNQIAVGLSKIHAICV